MSTPESSLLPAYLRLAWVNPEAPRKERQDLQMLRQLGDFLAGATRCGEFEGARRIAASHRLSPLALAVVVDRMQADGIGEELIRRVV